MEKITVSLFKAKALAFVDQVSKTGKKITILKFGKPVAELSPISAKSNGDNKVEFPFGQLKDTLLEMQDVITPIGDEDWEANQ